jgi:hypothetical protein
MVKRNESVRQCTLNARVFAPIAAFEREQQNVFSNGTQRFFLPFENDLRTRKRRAKTIRIDDPSVFRSATQRTHAYLLPDSGRFVGH